MSTGDRTFRDDLPPLLTESHKAAFSGFGEAPAQWKRRVIFLDRLLQVLVGVMAADAAGLGLPRPPQLQILLQKLDRPSLGDWAQAAWALSKELVRAPGRVAQGYPLVLATPDGRPTEAYPALDRLITLRNDEAHHKIPAAAALGESEGLFHILRQASHCLKNHTFHAILREQTLPGGMDQVQVVRLRGQEPESLDLRALRGIPAHMPFLVGEQGDVLTLMPFIALTNVGSSGIPDLLVLTGMDSQGPAWRGPSADAEDAPTAHHLKNRADVEKWLDRSLRLPALLNPRDLAHPSVENPRQIGPYTIEAALGAGATGRVFRAKGPNGQVAVKVLDPLVARDEALRSRLKREFRLMKQLQSPHVARVYDCEEDPVVGLYLAMEYIEGGDLGKAGPPATPDQALKWMGQVLAGLEQLHAQGIVHRDLKPGNILLRADRSVALVDLGIALQADATRATRKGEVLGTTAWAAPEQLLGLNVEPSADVYAAGRLLGWMYSGSVDPKVQATKLPDKLRSVWRRATQETPALRFPRAQEFLRAMQAAEKLDCMLMPGEFFGKDWQVISCMNSKYPGVALVLAEHMQVPGKRWFIAVLPGRRREEVLGILRDFSASERQVRGLGDSFDLADGTLVIPTAGKDGEQALQALVAPRRAPEPAKVGVSPPPPKAVAPKQAVPPPPKPAAPAAPPAPPSPTAKAPAPPTKPANSGSDIVVAAAALGAAALGLMGLAAVGGAVAGVKSAQNQKKGREGGGKAG